MIENNDTQHRSFMGHPVEDKWGEKLSTIIVILIWYDGISKIVLTCCQ